MRSYKEDMKMKVKNMYGKRIDGVIQVFGETEVAFIKANDRAIGSRELKHLQELVSFNKMLVIEEFYEIAKIYQKAIERVEAEAKDQGIELD